MARPFPLLGTPISRSALHALFAALILLAGLAPSRAADLTVYNNALASGWQNWSWSSTVDFAVTPAHSAPNAISTTFTAGWAGLYLHSTTSLPGSQYAALSFWINGGASGGQQIRVALYDGALAEAGTGATLTATANTWTHVQIPLGDLGSPAELTGIVFQENTGAAAPAVLLDDIVLIASNATPTPTPTPLPAPALSVDAGADRHPISPLIYGMNFCDEALAFELALPVRRWGGNATTRYNWQIDVSNHASDWYFENIAEDNPDPSTLPDGSAADRFLEQDRRTGTRTILTMPLIGWTPKSRDKVGGFSVAKYGPQQRTDPWLPDAGNGLHTDGSPVTGNDPRDTSAPIGPSFVTDWIAHLKARYGDADHGGVAFYNLDNEPMLWSNTHRDVHPAPLGYDEIASRTLAYAAAIKAADPGAATLGPVLWGWTAYFYSALDGAPGGNWWNNPADRNAHGGTPFVAWYLQQMHAYEQAHGTRLLDYLDLHYYPQAAGVSLSSAGGAATQALRLRSTRSLWDPAYTDESWIGEPVRMIPRMREWVDANYPGTKLGITEYNWGALDSINGALAQADVLGIFGREGLDLATLWGPPTATQPGAFAFRLYLNYDGRGNRFGNESVRATSADQDRLSVYAALRSGDAALTVMIINKTADALAARVALAGFHPGGAAEVYRYSAADLAAIIHAPALNATDAGFSATFPANSITLVVLPPSRSAASAGWLGVTSLPARAAQAAAPPAAPARAG